MMMQQRFNDIFRETQNHKMTAIAVATSGEILLAIGYDGTLKEMPTVEEMQALYPNAIIRYLSRSQVSSPADLVKIVSETVYPSF